MGLKEYLRALGLWGMYCRNTYILTGEPLRKNSLSMNNMAAAFAWDDSQEGHTFWELVYKAYYFIKKEDNMLCNSQEGHIFRKLIHEAYYFIKRG